MSNILEVKNLTKKYKGFLLDNISFNLERGYIMGFIGPNGAGKTTTIKLLMNLIKKDTGEIKFFEGLDSVKYERQIKQRIGFVYDENHFYDELTLLEMQNIIAGFYSRWDDDEFNKYMKRFELPSGKKIKELSKGMKMKYSLAIALSHNADLIIMDEPTSGLDPVFRREILDILSDLLQDESKSVFFSTHITKDLERIADYITFINDGKIVFSDSKDQILDSYGIVKGGNELLDQDIRKEFVGLRESRFGFEGLTKNISKVQKLLGSDVIIEKPSLDDIMVYTIRGNKDA